jgi:hypothetical protein
MAIQTINVGNIPNDGTGDDLREAFVKVNSNFLELNNSVTNIAVDAENLGVAGQGVFAGISDGTLQFKKIVAGSNVSVTSNSESVIINSTGGINSILVLTDNGSITVDGSNYLGINGGDVITTRTNANNLFIDLNDTGIVEHDTAPKLSASLNANDKNIQNVNAINANSFIGPLTGLVYGVDIRNINYYYENWDFGDLVEVQYSSIIDYIVKNTVIDLGALVGAGRLDSEIDLGTIA